MPEQAAADRRLAAIVFSDIVGYTSLTERDEARAIRARERHRSIARPLVEQFQGEIVNATGDDLLCLFPSALLAVDYALAIQAVLRDNADLQLRMGVHLGDVIRRDGEVIGEGVNVAARIRPLAEPGGICISEAVHRMVRGQPHIRARSLGRQALKNVQSPLEVFALDAGEQSDTKVWWRRPPVRVLAGFALIIALGYAIYLPNRGAILAGIALNLPRLVGPSIEQKIGFATTSDGVRIAYATTGQGPALVYAIGWATHLQDGLGSPLYDPFGFLVRYSEHYTLVRYDGRGFGMSDDRDVTDFSLDARVRDLEAVVDALGLRRFVIRAVSASGPTAIAYTARNPDRVSALILAATNAGRDLKMTPEVRQATEDMIAVIRTGWESPAVRAMMVELVWANSDEVTKRVVNEFLRRSGSGAAVAGFFEQGLQIDTRDLARRLEVPTLVIHGTRDMTMPIEGGREVASLIPGARFEILQGADHIADSGGDPRVWQLIEVFLRDHGDDSAAGG